MIETNYDKLGEPGNKSNGAPLGHFRVGLVESPLISRQVLTCITARAVKSGAPAIDDGV